MLATFLPLGFQEGLLTRSFPLSWGDLCHRTKYPAVLHFPSWLLFSKATACSVRDFAFSSMADNEKYQTYGRTERILQWIPITYHLDFTINIQLHLLYHHHHPSIHSENCIFSFGSGWYKSIKKRGKHLQDWKGGDGLVLCGDGGLWPWISQCLRGRRTERGMARRCARLSGPQALRCPSGAQTWQICIPGTTQAPTLVIENLDWRLAGFPWPHFCIKSLGAFEQLLGVRERLSP